MNMDQVMVLTYTDRNHKTRVVGEEEFYELFVCENGRGRCMNDEQDWLDQFDGEFGYIKFYQAVINGELNDFQEVAEDLNRHWSTRGEPGVCGVYGFVNAGVLDVSMFNEHTFDTQEPSDYQAWKRAREHNYVPGSTLEETLVRLRAKVAARGETVSTQVDEDGELRLIVEKTPPPRKPWLL